MNPTVSVIIPTHNRAPLLKEAVESVLSQTVAPSEVLVVDDGSTDDTRDIVGTFGDRVRYFRQESGGAATARNLGIEQAHGEFLAFLDDDDVWVPEALEWRLARFQEADVSPAEIVMGLTQRVTLADSTPVYSAWAARLFGSALIRRAVIARVGLLDPAFRYGDDMDWFLRVRELDVPLVFLDRVTLLYRIHGNSLMSQPQNAKKDLLLVLKKSLARRAAANGGVVKPLTEMPDLQEILAMMQEATG